MDMPIAVTFRNGNTVRTRVAPDRLTHYLGNLVMEDVTGIKYGADAATQEFRLGQVDIHQSRDRSTFDLTFFDKDDKQAGYIKSTPVKVQEFALRLLQQTSYAFQDLAER